MAFRVVKISRAHDFALDMEIAGQDITFFRAGMVVRRKARARGQFIHQHFIPRGSGGTKLPVAHAGNRMPPTCSSGRNVRLNMTGPGAKPKASAGMSNAWKRSANPRSVRDLPGDVRQARAGEAPRLGMAPGSLANDPKTVARGV